MPLTFTQWYSPRIEALLPWIAHRDPLIRSAASECVALVAWALPWSDRDAGAAGQTAAGDVSDSQLTFEHVLRQTLAPPPTLPAGPNAAQGQTSMGGSGMRTVDDLLMHLLSSTAKQSVRDVEAIHGAIATISRVARYVFAAATQPAVRSAPGAPRPGLRSPLARRTVLACIGQLAHTSPLVRVAACTAISEFTRGGVLPLPPAFATSTDAATTGSEAGVGTSTGSSSGGGIRVGKVDLSTVLSRRTLVETLQRLSLHQEPFGDAIQLQGLGPAGAMLGSMKSSVKEGSGKGKGKEGGKSAQMASNVVKAAAVALGALAGHDDSAEVASSAVTALVALGVNRSEDVQFSVARALVEACSGKPMAVDEDPLRTAEATVVADRPDERAIRVNMDTLAPVLAEVSFFGMLTVHAAAPRAGEGGEGEEVVEACHGPLGHSVLQAVTGHILGVTLGSPHALVRSASAVWLLHLVYRLGTAPELRERLWDLHTAFSRLIAEKSEFVQEIAAKVCDRSTVP